MSGPVPPAPKPGESAGSGPPKPAAPPQPSAAPPPPAPAQPFEPPSQQPTTPAAEKPPQEPAQAPPPKPPQPPGPAASPNGDKSVGELFLEVSEQATVLVREEIELAKTEVTEKLSRLLRGSAVGLVAGIFLLLALLLVMHGIAILLGDNVFGHRAWLGYLVEAAAFVLIAAGGGFYAYRALKKSAPPLPEMAIEEAKEIRASFDPSEGSK
jgi:uncharacterized membrane protein YqjE